MQRSLTEHGIYIQTLRNKWKWQSLTSEIIEGITLYEAYTFFFGLIKLGDLCNFINDDGEGTVGLISEMKYVVTTTHNKVHLWCCVLVGEDEYIFHTRLDEHHYNDALLYTKSEADPICKVEILGEL